MQNIDGCRFSKKQYTIHEEVNQHMFFISQQKLINTRCYTFGKVVEKMVILLVPVIMACATVGTIGMIKGINHFNNRRK